MKEKTKKYLRRTRKLLETKKSHQKNKHLSSPPCKIIGTILKMDKGRTQTNGPPDKKVDDDA